MTRDPGTTARRTLLRGAVATVGAAALGPLTGTSARADTPAEPPTAQGSRAAVRRLGRYRVLALLDAHGTFPVAAAAAFPDATPEAWERARELDPPAFGPHGTWELDFRCYAVRAPGGRITLVDTGIGPVGSPASKWAPVPGRLPQSLTAAGIRPQDVDTVVLSHLHEDHYGWSVTPDGVPVFPDAQYVVQQAEVAGLAAGDSALRYVVDPLRRAGLLRQVDGRCRLPGPRGAGAGLTLFGTPGHTPGHQSLLVEGGGQRLLITGDVLVHAVQLADPATRYAFEADPALARRTREALLAEAGRTGTVLATPHLNRPFLPLPAPDAPRH
ncbi:MBL fold metallo-hydrolase [Streptomyces sp. SP17BM10]|uniref:MBL fold metallo-hydrolase n=1 Tax=Streptomyces sp. SP17BM10 TaxID=3002530 RepID=UPI002E75BD2F|nr:MBL fold metallo-hydrolase [Streptomyces sp. SP17BM10]MEE1783823.1 MBL fold metallo-hydrolase [Streptomyces sp. SP17BM10]